MPFPSFHAHVYYQPETAEVEVARALREEIARQFPVQLGRWHDVPVGPHVQAMYQIAFDAAHFAGVTQALMELHGNLPVLIHPNSDDPVADHTRLALWLGPQLPVNVAFLEQFAATGGRVDGRVE